MHQVITPQNPLFRHSRRTHQHPQRRWLSQLGAHVLRLVDWPFLHARPGQRLADRAQPRARARARARVRAQSSLGGSRRRCQSPGPNDPTGRNPVPDWKARIGYRFEPNKFEPAHFTEAPSDLVRPPRVAECPVQLEAKVQHIHAFGVDDPRLGPDSVAAIETHIVRIHIDERLLIPGAPNYIDAEKWKPLIMSFCEFFGLTGKLHPSTLAPAFYDAPKPAEPAAS